MMQLPQQGGASVQARGRIPSTNLASLVSFLVEAYPPKEDRPGNSLSWPVLRFDPAKGRLGVNTYGLLKRFLAQKEMLQAFRQSDASGFLRDIASPPKSFTAKMGGKVFQDDMGGVSKAVSQLKQLISEQLEQLPGSSPQSSP